MPKTRSNFEKAIKDSIINNILRLSDGLSSNTLNNSKYVAKKVLLENKKMIEKYFDGRSVISELVDRAKLLTSEEIDDRLTGEWIAYFLDDYRSKNIKNTSDDDILFINEDE